MPATKEAFVNTKVSLAMQLIEVFLSFLWQFFKSTFYIIERVLCEIARGDFSLKLKLLEISSL